MRIRVGTRGSPLALAQTETALRRLRELRPRDTFTVEVIQSSADRSPDAPLASMPRGVFAKELEVALADGVIDMAVHSFKDLPIEASPDCAVAAVTERADPRDALVAPGRRLVGRYSSRGPYRDEQPAAEGAALCAASRPRSRSCARERRHARQQGRGRRGSTGRRRRRGGSCQVGLAGCGVRTLRSGVFRSRGGPGRARPADQGRRRHDGAARRAGQRP